MREVASLADAHVNGTGDRQMIGQLAIRVLGHGLWRHEHQQHPGPYELCGRDSCMADWQLAARAREAVEG